MFESLIEENSAAKHGGSFLLSLIRIKIRSHGGSLTVKNASDLFWAVTNVDLPLCNESLMLLDLVSGCGVTYIFTFGLFLLETLFTSVVWPFRSFGGRGLRT